eukprot:5295203-Prymnesium_polylepis.3
MAAAGRGHDLKPRANTHADSSGSHRVQLLRTQPPRAAHSMFGCALFGEEAPMAAGGRMRAPERRALLLPLALCGDRIEEPHHPLGLARF